MEQPEDVALVVNEQDPGRHDSILTRFMIWEFGLQIADLWIGRCRGSRSAPGLRGEEPDPAESRPKVSTALYADLRLQKLYWARVSHPGQSSTEGLGSNRAFFGQTLGTDTGIDGGLRSAVP